MLEFFPRRSWASLAHEKCRKHLKQTTSWQYSWLCSWLKNMVKKMKKIQPDTDPDIEPHAAHATCTRHVSAHQVPSLQTSNELSDGLEPPLNAKSTEGHTHWVHGLAMLHHRQAFLVFPTLYRGSLWGQDNLYKFFEILHDARSGCSLSIVMFDLPS